MEKPKSRKQKVVLNVFLGNGPGHISNPPGYLRKSPGEFTSSPATLTRLMVKSKFLMSKRDHLRRSCVSIARNAGEIALA